MGWKVLKCSNSTDIFAEYENFLDFYNLTAQVTFENLYKIKISLWYKDCYCYYDKLEIEDADSIPRRIEEHIKNNFKNVYELPRFIKLLDEMGLSYQTFIPVICIGFPFLTDKYKLARIDIWPETDDLKGRIEKCQSLLLDDWETIRSFSGIEKYCNNEVSVEEVGTDPIFPG